MAVVLVLLVVLVAIVVMRPPRGPDGPDTAQRLEAYLLAQDRRHKQLRKDHLTDW